jgi:DNA/RNA non-specific endonuclease
MRSILALTFAVVGCGGAPSPKDATTGDATNAAEVDRLEVEFGGPGGLMAFFNDAPDATIADALESHDIGFARHALLTACNPTFPQGDRNTWHAFDGEFYFIEASGRPNRAYKYLPPVVAAPRISGCQTTVGQWGDQEDEDNDYDGGHMIGSQLGGYGGRINLVPQDANFNRGNWVQIENKAADCGALPDERIFYYVRADYHDTTSLVPATMSLTLENRVSEDSVSFEFENTDGGGLDGVDQRLDAVAFLEDQGCN